MSAPGSRPCVDLELAHALAHPRQQAIGDVADGDEDRDRHAALAGRAVGGADRRIGREIQVGVGQDDHVVLRAAERLHALAVPRAGLVDVPRDRRRPDEAHRLDARVRQDGVDRDLVAVDDVEDARRQAGFGEELGAEHRPPTGPSRTA